MEYKAFEMHTHTLHSDGKFTVAALCRAALEQGFDGFALTDHNTLAPHEELTAALARETLPAVRGIEWTTFFGHVLVLGCEEFVDWRFVTPDTIDEALLKIHRAGGIAGVAHPFALGSPFCTGCHWQFNVRDWSLIDYIEVWSGASPQHDPINARAFQWWTDLLNRGYRLAATQGRDWHGVSKTRENMTVTYLGIEGAIDTSSAKEALQAGRSYVTCGPTVSFSVEQEGAELGLGATVHPGGACVKIELDTDARSVYWGGFGIVPRELRIVQNGAARYTFDCTEQHQYVKQMTLYPGWLRLEVYGDYMGRENTLLAFTGPIYCSY